MANLLYLVCGHGRLFHFHAYAALSQQFVPALAVL